MKTLVQSLTLTFTTRKTFIGRFARTWRLPLVLLVSLIQALIFANAGAAALAGTVRITSGNGAFSAISESNKTLTVAPGANLTGTINLHTTNEGSSGWIAPLIFTPSWGDPSTSWRSINDWISTNPSDYQATVSVVAPTAPGVYHIIFAFWWEIGADHVASGTNWQVGADIWNDGDEIANLSPTRIAEAQANGFTVAPRLVPTGSELFNTPADAVTLIVTGAPTTASRFIYRVTSNAYPFDADWMAAVAAEFGPNANVADWNTIKTDFGGSVASIQAFMDGIGLTTYYSGASVYLGGQQFFDAGRTYFLERHDGVLPQNWLAHDTIQAHTADLGSWYQDRPILARFKLRTEPTLRGPVDGEPAGTKYLSFGTPQVGAFAATISGGKSGISVIIGSDGHVLLKVGHSVPELAGSVITKLDQPSGDAVLATLALSPANGITARNNIVLVGGLGTGAPQIAARIGTANPALPTEVTIKSFGPLDGNGSGVFFLATLQGRNVTPKNANALCVALGDGSVKVLARTGDVVGGKTIATIGTLVGSAGTLAEGRWRVNETTCGVRLTFSDTAKTQAIYSIRGTATTSADWTLLIQTGAVSNVPAINGSMIRSFGLPSFGPGASAAVVANLAVGPGGITNANHYALLGTNTGANTVVLARTGDTIAADANGTPWSHVKISVISDPVAGAHRVTALVVTVVGPLGIAIKGIMYSPNGGTPALLANVGAAAPGGGHWASLGALVLPDGTRSGPVFLGNLVVRSADGVSALNNRGLWGVDSNGALKLLLRAGQPVTIGTVTKTLASFTALTASPGSVGAASGHDATGRIAVLAVCTDGTRALLTIEVP